MKRTKQAHKNARERNYMESQIFDNKSGQRHMMFNTFGYFR